jgi:hypothetical protein
MVSAVISAAMRPYSGASPERVSTCSAVAPAPSSRSPSLLLLHLPEPAQACRRFVELAAAAMSSKDDHSGWRAEGDGVGSRSLVLRPTRSSPAPHTSSTPDRRRKRGTTTQNARIMTMATDAVMIASALSKR